MRRNKLIILTFVSIASLAFAACGGDDDDGGTVDAAPPTIDAATNTTPDAMTTTALEGLGARCADPSECTDPSATQCLGQQGAPNGNCTLSCGTSQDPQMPPATGDAACEAAYKGATGTPACVIRTSDTPPVEWFCSVLCGTAGGTSLGECPLPTTCALRAGQTYGDCN